MTSRPVRPAAVALAAALALCLAPRAAQADLTKDQCIDANSRAQDLRRDHKLSLALEQLRLCADASCPAIVRGDCTKRLDEIDSIQPTIAFEVKDASGGDLTAVRVTVDGKQVAERVDGSAIALDPGPHVAVFESAGLAPVTRNLVLTEGQKGRHERIAFAGPSAGGTPPRPVAPTAVTPAAPPSSPVAAPVAPVSGGGMGTQKVLGLTAAGVGVVGLALGGVFGGLTLSEKSQQQSDCPNSTCSASGRASATNDHSAGMTDSAVSTAGFIAGGVLLVTGAVVFFTGHASDDRPGTTALQVTPGVGPGGGSVLLQGRF